MWTYKVDTGEAVDEAGKVHAGSYSGHGEGRNNPAMEAVHDVGPIPRGQYIIHPPVDTQEHGPFVLALTPADNRSRYGRGGFLWHGDSKAAPGTASKGCIVSPHDVRVTVWGSGDRWLLVR